MDSGGPYVYKSMVKTMNKFNLPAQEQSEVMAMLGGMKGDIANH